MFLTEISLTQEKEKNRMNKRSTSWPTPRNGCKDIWNAHMVKGALFTSHDIPHCPTTAIALPEKIITWEEAKSLHKRNLSNKNAKYKENSFVCFYLDDYKFDGQKGIWHNPNKALNVLQHFAGVITPDFSTNQDFPEPIKIYNTYRMRAFGYWLGINGIPVINNVRWGTPNTYDYSFAGVEKNSIIAIGTCGGSPLKLLDRKRFNDGLSELVNRLRPHTIIVYGSSNYPCFEELSTQGIVVISYPSRKAKFFEGRDCNE